MAQHRVYLMVDGTILIAELRISVSGDDEDSRVLQKMTAGYLVRPVQGISKESLFGYISKSANYTYLERDLARDPAVIPLVSPTIIPSNVVVSADISTDMRKKLFPTE